MSGSISSVIATATTASVNAMIRSDSRRDSSPLLLSSGSSESAQRFIVELVSSDSVMTASGASPRVLLLLLVAVRVRLTKLTLTEARLLSTDSLCNLARFEEAKSILRRTMPVARRVLGESHHTMLQMRWIYGQALYNDPSASLDHLREAVMMYEDNARIARRVSGGAHPLVVDIEHGLRCARAALRTRETPSSGDA